MKKRPTIRDVAALAGVSIATVSKYINAAQRFTPAVERKIRAAIRSIPDGVYPFEDWMDDDGVGGPPVALRVRITVAGDRIALDFGGTGPQVPGDVNVVYRRRDGRYGLIEPRI